MLRVVLMFALVASLPTAYAFEFTCPQKTQIATGALEPLAAPGAKGIVSDRPLYLDGFMLYSGPPEELASLKPHGSKRKGDVSSAVWIRGANEHAFWASCQYAVGVAQIAVPVPTELTRCEMSVTHTSKPKAMHVRVRCGV